MSFDLFMDDTCPKCRKPLRLAVIEPHATRRDLAVHKFDCADCGPVRTKILFQNIFASMPNVTGIGDLLAAEARLIADNGASATLATRQWHVEMRVVRT